MADPQQTPASGPKTVQASDVSMHAGGVSTPLHATGFQIITTPGDTVVIFQRLVVDYSKGANPELKNENLVAISLALGTAKGLLQILGKTIADYENQVQGIVPVAMAISTPN